MFITPIPKSPSGKLANLSDAQLERAVEGMSYSYNHYPTHWFAYQLDTYPAPFGSLSGEDVAGRARALVRHGDSLAASMRRVWKDTRYTDSGRISVLVGNLETFMKGGPGSQGALDARDYVERQSDLLMNMLDALKYPRQDKPQGAEWRKLIRESSDVSGMRFTKLASLVNEGNDDALEAVLAAGPGLSGLTESHYRMAVNRAKVLHNRSIYLGIRSHAEALVNLYMLAMRGATGLVAVSGLNESYANTLEEAFTVKRMTLMAQTFNDADNSIGVFSTEVERRKELEKRRKGFEVAEGEQEE